MKSSDWAVIIVALVSLGSAFLSSRSAKAAQKYNTDASLITERMKAETDAYTRSRETYLATLKHQDEEILDLRNELREIKAANNRLNQENMELKRRVSVLERQVGEDNG